MNFQNKSIIDKQTHNKTKALEQIIVPLIELMLPCYSDTFEKLSSIELFKIKLPLVHPFRTSFGEESSKHAILVKITDIGGNIGWGETSVERNPSYCYETIVTGWHIQNDFLIPRIKGINKDNFTLKNIYDAWKPIRGHEFAKSGIESALLTLLSMQQNKSLGELYGLTRDKIPTGVSIGIQKSIEHLIQRIDHFLSLGYKRIKLKIEPGWDVEMLKKVRKEFGDIDLMVDANSAYTLDNIPLFQEIDQFGLTMVEQPLAYNDLLDHRKLQQEIQTPICLDESIHNPRDARNAIEIGACKIINIKPGRVGGYSNAIEISQELGEGAVWCGGMLETGVGRIHNLLFQARDEFTIPGDTSGSNRYFNPDIITPEVIVDGDGYISVPKGIGLGHKVNEDYIVKSSFAHEKISLAN